VAPVPISFIWLANKALAAAIIKGIFKYLNKGLFKGHKAKAKGKELRKGKKEIAERK